MSKQFRPWKIDETPLLPPSVEDYVAEDHLSRLIVFLVSAFAFLRERAVFVAADRQGDGGAGGLHDDRGGRSTGLPHDLGLPQAASEGAGCFICAGIEACGKGGPGEARARGARRHKDQSERLETQGDEL